MKVPTEILIALAILTFIISLAQSAIIKGNVYSWELNKISAIVEINTTPKQRIVAVNGSYEFSVPTGIYLIEAYSTDRELSCSETIVITSNGTYILDLILFPTLKYNELNFTEPSFEIDEGNQAILMTASILTILAAVTAVLGIIMVKKKPRTPDSSELPEDLTQILKILKESGGRATQKELREKTGWSEAKLSLVLTDLERRGLIEKYKKGRGNVIFLK